MMFEHLDLKLNIKKRERTTIEDTSLIYFIFDYLD